jgi:Lrp/AsnC family leucine-responsive transcriptional regulator
MILDPIDKKLLLLLQTDKENHKGIILKLNLSVTAVYERIKKLEREGIIDKYVVVLINPKSRRVLLFFVI